MISFQQTIKDSIEFSGFGLFTGEPVSVRFKPASVNTGIRFVRPDLAGSPSVTANTNSISSDTRRVFFKNSEVEVESVEHLMACLAGLEIDNLEIEINNREMPVGDGSSLKFIELFRETEIVKQSAEKSLFISNNKIIVSDGDANITVIPNGEGLTISYILDYNGDYVSDEFTFPFSVSGFCNEIAPARTFGIDSDVSKFKKSGLGKGITDDNTFVVQRNGKFLKPLSMSPAKLRFPDECVRHKILDLIGDLSSSNLKLSGHIIAEKSGHSLNIKMAKKLVEVSKSTDN